MDVVEPNFFFENLVSGISIGTGETGDWNTYRNARIHSPII